MVTVNCIGVGHWGPNLVRSFVVNPASRVNMVCDLSEERLALIKRNVPGVERFSTSAIEAIECTEADAVVIATPVAHHYELARKALLSGKHVLVEKPLCHTVAQGIELANLAQERGLILAVGHIFLFNAGILAVKKMIDAGELGSIRYIFSTRTNLGPIRNDVNAMWDLASHDISIFNYWLGAEPEGVTANGQRLLGGQTEDVVVGSFRYPGGIVASVHASWLNPRKVREITVVGEDRMLVWDDLDLNEPVRLYNKSVAKEVPYGDTFGAFRMQLRQGEVVIPYITGPEPLAAECAHFIDCIEKNKQPVNDAFGAVSVLRALEASDNSIQANSQWVSLARQP